MEIRYKNRRLEKALIAVNVLAAVSVAGSFVMLFGFEEPLVAADILYNVQFFLLGVFIAEKIVRFFNAVSIKEFFQGFWVQIPLLVALVIVLAGAGRWGGQARRGWYLSCRPGGAEGLPNRGKLGCFG